MAEFERTMETVNGRSIWITSWFDENRGSWRASAPAYTHLSFVTALSQESCASRKAATARLRHLLAAHFDPDRR